jgi:hypothetical protein
MMLSAEGVPTSTTEGVDLCVVTTHASQNAGQMVRVAGWLGQWPHDLLLVSEGCPDDIVVVEFAENASVRPSPDFSVVRDRRFRRLHRYLRKSFDFSKGVRATLEGRFDVAEFAGFVRNESGDIIKIEGYGSPAPFARFRLVLHTVADVTIVPDAPKLPAPQGLGPSTRIQ